MDAKKRATTSNSSMKSAFADERLVIGSCNLKNSVERVGCLVEHARHMPRPFDIICVQDPPSVLPWTPGLTPYKLWYVPIKELQAEDDPRSKPLSERIQLLKKRVVFFVHESIPDSDWKVHTYNDSNADLVATLTISTPSGDVDIHNIYNPLKAIDIDQLLDSCSFGGAHILMGDFNLHHPTWCEDDMEYVVEKEAEKLDQALTAANMKLLSRRGAITYSRSSQVDQNCSTIDLTFGGDIIVGRDPQWDIVDAIGFESDHRVTQISLDIKPSRLTSTRFNWKRANREHVSKAVKTALKSLGNPVLASTAEVVKYATDMVSLLCAAMSKTVPLVKPRALRPDLKGLANVRSAFDDAQNALKMSNSESASERGHTSAHYPTLRLRA